MKRVEFTRAVKAKVYHRAKGRCENPQCPSPHLIRKLVYDHINPCVFSGIEGGTEANCQLLCEECHAAKTKLDIRAISKSNRIRKREIGPKEWVIRARREQ